MMIRLITLTHSHNKKVLVVVKKLTLFIGNYSFKWLRNDSRQKVNF